MKALFRCLMGFLVFAGLLLGPSCAPAAPGATPTAAKPVATATLAPQPTSSPAAPRPATSAKPAATASAGASATDWKAEWDQTVAAAKKEGKLVVAGAPGGAYRQAMQPFEKAYPEIKVEFTGFGGPDLVPRLMAERDGGQYLWDVWLSGWDTPLSVKRILDPLKPLIFLPEILDNNAWYDGLDNAWVDREKQYTFTYSAYINYLAYANTDIVPESELKTVDLLVDPRWKGKIGMLDPRVAGGSSVRFGHVLLLRGEDWVRKLLGQDVAVLKEGRQLVEGLIRGTYPIAWGPSSGDFEQLSKEGLMTKIKEIAADTPEGTRVNTGYGHISFINKAPHPNAAKLFANWLLSKEGQKAYVEITGVNSRRLDVPSVPGNAPDPSVKYLAPQIEGSPLQEATNRAMSIAKEMIK